MAKFAESLERIWPQCHLEHQRGELSSYSPYVWKEEVFYQERLDTPVTGDRMWKQDSSHCGLQRHDRAVGREGHHLPWNHFLAVFQSVYGGLLDAAAAGNLHTDDGDGLNVVFL